MALHHKAYYSVRSKTMIGSQMICIAIKSVASAYKVLKIKKDQAVPTLFFKDSGRVHFDKRTYSIKGNRLSLYTLDGRVLIPMVMGNLWFFNLVLDLPDVLPAQGGGVIGIDLGENNLATTSLGKIFGGGQLRYERD